MKLGIVIPTYQRGDGTTPSLLTRALNSIKNQTHSDYKVFLIGDKYDDDDEFTQLATGIIDIDKIYYENLSVAVEREKYPIGSSQLWCSGGVNATNYGIEKCLSDGIEYIFRLDHDDWWEPNHLEKILNAILILGSEYIFFATKSNHIKNQILPRKSNGGDYYPSSGDLVHSSICIKFSDIPLRYRDTSWINSSDADFWERLTNYMAEIGKRGYLVNSVTCNHITERN